MLGLTAVFDVALRTVNSRAGEESPATVDDELGTKVAVTSLTPTEADLGMDHTAFPDLTLTDLMVLPLTLKATLPEALAPELSFTDAVNGAGSDVMKNCADRGIASVTVDTALAEAWDIEADAKAVAAPADGATVRVRAAAMAPTMQERRLMDMAEGAPD